LLERCGTFEEMVWMFHLKPIWKNIASRKEPGGSR